MFSSMLRRPLGQFDFLLDREHVPWREETKEAQRAVTEVDRGALSATSRWEWGADRERELEELSSTSNRLEVGANACVPQTRSRQGAVRGNWARMVARLSRLPAAPREISPGNNSTLQELGHLRLHVWTRSS